MATYRQVQAAKNLVENGGNTYQAMRDAGYSHATAKTPKKLTESKGFQELLDQYSPIEAVAQELGRLLEASSLAHYTFPSIVSDEEIREVVESKSDYHLWQIKHKRKVKVAHYFQPDWRSRASAIHMLLRIRGDYASSMGITPVHTDELSDTELDNKIIELEIARRIRK